MRSTKRRSTCFTTSAMQAPPKRKSEGESEASDAAKASRAPTLPSGESKSTEPIGFECAR